MAPARVGEPAAEAPLRAARPLEAPGAAIPRRALGGHHHDLGRRTHAHQRTSSYALVNLNPMLEMTATMMKMITEMAVARP